MIDVPNRYVTRTQAEAAQIDVGLRQHMLRVFNYMASGVLLSGIVAFAVASSPTAIQLIFGTPLYWVVILAPLGMIFFLSYAVNRLSFFTAQATYWALTATIGASLASILLLYTGASVARVFFISAATFAAMSLYGYTTKADLSRFGSFLLMGLIGIVLASVVNLFMASSALQFAISVIGVLVFVGLTAYDTQRIKEVYVENLGHEAEGKLALMGALSLYLNFINLFQLLMSLLGQRNNE
jgi:uncharacterized protein